MRICREDFMVKMMNLKVKQTYKKKKKGLRPTTFKVNLADPGKGSKGSSIITFQEAIFLGGCRCISVLGMKYLYIDTDGRVLNK